MFPAKLTLAVENISHTKPVLRAVAKTTADKSRDPHRTGIILERVDRIRCPHCREVVVPEDDTPLSSTECPKCGKDFLVPGRVDGFLLHGHIGEGEMGTIYRATDETLHREVAVKVVRGCLSDDPASLERLHKEGVAASKVNHPKVAQVYALNFSNDHPYLVMEFVTGLDFAEKLKQEGTVDEKTALRLALDVSEGLTALHREGQVHGDIKPGNIVLDRDGNAKLVDFGLSGMMRHDGKGNLVGTPHYLAPELLRGSPDSHRSDIYSLGATLYYLLCGRLPYDGDTPTEMLRAKLNSDPIPLSQFAPHISEATATLIMQMLQREPEKRLSNSATVTEKAKKALAQLESPRQEPAETPLPGTSGIGPAAAASAARPARSVFRSGGAAPHRTASSTGRIGAEFLHQSPSEGMRQRIPPPQAGSRRRPVTALLLALVAVVEIAVAIKQQSFPQTWEWLRDDAVSDLKQSVMSLKIFRSEPPAPPQDLSLGSNIAWKSTSVGTGSKRGSTVQQGEVLVLQSTGEGMWDGADSGRFVWTAASSNYVFSAKIQSFSSSDELDITGLMIKGPDPAHGSSVLFGYLGNGKLFLQTRGPSAGPKIVKCAISPSETPGFLRIVRSGDLFEADVSENGSDWQRFAECRSALPVDGTAGLTVSPHREGTLATAKFSAIHLKSADPEPVATNDNRTAMQN